VLGYQACNLLSLHDRHVNAMIKENLIHHCLESMCHRAVEDVLVTLATLALKAIDTLGKTLASLGHKVEEASPQFDWEIFIKSQLTVPITSNRFGTILCQKCCSGTTLQK
jgi:hypothetical protein